MEQSQKSVPNLSAKAVLSVLTQLFIVTGVAFAAETREFTLQEVRDNSEWEVLNLDIRIDITQGKPRYSGTLRMNLTGEKIIRSDDNVGQPFGQHIRSLCWCLGGRKMAGIQDHSSLELSE